MFRTVYKFDCEGVFIRNKHRRRKLFITDIYRPQTMFGDGNVFTGICQVGGGVR